MNTKYRGLYFLGATILVGVFIIAITRLMNSTTTMDTEGKIMNTIDRSNPHKSIEQKIAQITVKTVEPSLYNTLLIEINNGATQGLYNDNIRKMLIDNLNQQYQSLAIQKVNGIVAIDPINASELEKYLGHLEAIFGLTTNTKTVRSNLKTILYYSNTLPNKVNGFINQGYGSFEESVFQSLMQEINNAPAHIKSRKLVNNNLKNLKNKILQHRLEYIQWNLNVN